MKGKRLSRREMKEDALVTLAFRAVDFVKKHRSKVILAVALVVVAIAGTAYVSSSRKGAENEACQQLLAGMLQQRANNHLGAAAAYEDVVSRHSGTKSGKTALLYLGHARYELGQYDQASEAYQRYLGREKGDKLTVAQAKRGLAACKENTGKFEEAADLYQQVARTLDKDDAIPEDLMFAARSLKLAGKPDKAVELLQEIVDSYPKYQEVDRARVILAEIQYGSSR